MSIKSDRWITRMAREHQMIEPFEDKQVREGVISYGVSSYGYDMRIADEFKIFTNVNSTIVDPKNFDPRSFVDFQGDVCVIPPNSFALARTVEYFRIPRSVLTICVGKSTYARCGIIVNVTPFEPEWEGIVTLEVSNTTPLPAKIYAERGHRPGALLRERRGLRDLVRRQEGQVPGPAGPHPAQALTALMISSGSARRQAVVQETVTMEGHLIDSDILRKVFNRIVEEGGDFDVLDFHVGKTNDDPSRPRLAVKAADPRSLDRILEGLSYLGAPPARGDARFAPAEADGILPDEFYSTTNFDTLVRMTADGPPSRDQKMDCALVLRDGAPRCVKQGQVRKGEPVALRGHGIRVRPPERSRDFAVFGFMSNDVSAEINKGIAIEGTAREMRRTREPGEKIVVVAGPAIVHSGGDASLARLVREGWVDVLLTGNAFAVHDLEKAIVGTSLGVCQMSGRAVEGGSRNHLFAINAVNRAGGIKAAVESGPVTSGVMYEAVKKGIPFVLAGSIRDDGPLLDDASPTRSVAQKAYVEALKGAGTCLMLASAPPLHRGREPAARARAHGVRGHDGVGAGEARQPRHPSGHRPGDRRRLLPRAAGDRAQLRYSGDATPRSLPVECMEVGGASSR